MKRMVFLAPLALFVVLGIYFAAGLTRDPSYMPSALIDQPLPVFDLAAIEGEKRGFATSDLDGEVALINFFGSWCISCIVEHPVLMDIAAREEVIIAGIDWKDKPGAGARWLEQRGNPYTLIGDDPTGRTAIDFGITGAPETFIIDRKGRIRYRFAGPITPLIWKRDLKPLVEQLRQEGDDGP
jgi:cytochrome c biogenesis protein CcmG, thiol:disulfide interchange protein DsbE